MMIDGSNARRRDWVWTAWAPKAADTSQHMFYFPKSVQDCSIIIESHEKNRDTINGIHQLAVFV